MLGWHPRNSMYFKQSSGIGRGHGKREVPTRSMVNGAGSQPLSKSTDENASVEYGRLKQEVDGRLSKGGRSEMIPIYIGLLDMYVKAGQAPTLEYLSSKSLSELNVISRAFQSTAMTKSWKDQERVVNYLLERIQANATKGNAFR